MRCGDFLTKGNFTSQPGRPSGGACSQSASSADREGPCQHPSKGACCPHRCSSQSPEGLVSSSARPVLPRTDGARHLWSLVSD